MKKILILVLLIIITPMFNTKAFGVSAQSIILMDMNSNVVLYEQNAHQRMKTASIAKIMTAIVAIENGFLDEYVEVTRDSVYQIGSKIYIQEGDSIKLIDLIYGLMLRSGNDAAYLIAEHVMGYDRFIIEMNEYAKKIGMTNTTFENPSGLDEETINYSTSYDMALLMSYAMKNDIFKDITSTKYHKCQTENGMQYVWRNKHRLVQKGDKYTGGKTGYTKAAGRTLVTTATKDDLNLVVVSFRASNDWNDHSLLFNFGFTNYENYLVMKAQSLKVRSELYDYVPYIERDVTVPVRKDSDEKVDVRIYLKNNATNDVIGKVVVYIDGREIFERNIYKIDVEEDKRTFLEIIKSTII